MKNVQVLKKKLKKKLPQSQQPLQLRKCQEIPQKVLQTFDNKVFISSWYVQGFQKYAGSWNSPMAYMTNFIAKYDSQLGPSGNNF